jgi:mitochondrial ATPase complex subunit ATP10
MNYRSVLIRKASASSTLCWWERHPVSWYSQSLIRSRYPFSFHRNYTVTSLLLSFKNVPSPQNQSLSTSLNRRLEDANPERIHGIKVNPDSLGNEILPGNLIYKTYKWTGNVRKIPVELAKGYFWMVSDLKKTNQKPTLSNDSLIPEIESQTFPTLMGLRALSDPGTAIDLPWGLINPNDEVEGKITLVAVTFRDNGFRLVPSWKEPFEQAFEDTTMETKVQIYQVSITEHWLLYPLRGFLTKVMRNNTPPKEQSKTLVYFGNKDLEEFRDVLRMHNIMTNYVFLLDDIGRVRFAGSGLATEDEVANLIQFTKELVAESGGDRSSFKKKR